MKTQLDTMNNNLHVCWINSVLATADKNPSPEIINLIENRGAECAAINEHLERMDWLKETASSFVWTNSATPVRWLPRSPERHYATAPGDMRKSAGAEPSVNRPRWKSGKLAPERLWQRNQTEWACLLRAVPVTTSFKHFITLFARLP